MIIGLTGQRGTLGGRISRNLETHGHEIRAFVGDIRNSDESLRWVKGLDRIVHCAAIVPIVRVNADPYGAAETNVLGTLNLAKLTELTNDRHLTYISTSHVYKDSLRPLAEDNALEPISLYGLTKLQGEQWVQALAPRYLIVRVFSFFAGDQNDRFLAPSLAKRIAAATKRASLDLIGADARRDIASADWIAETCSRLVLTGKLGIVNCGTGQGHSVANFARKLGRAMGREDIRWRLPGTSPDHGQSQLVADVSRLTGFLGQEPSFDLDAALSALCNESEPLVPLSLQPVAVESADGVNGSIGDKAAKPLELRAGHQVHRCPSRP